MGVHGLWELLAPVGRRVSVETLAGKKLAIDASIWMVQFMKAMRDEKGEMIRNAHILGFFRRICKLLFLRTKPVFVFDGATPALKRRTVIARRRQRENAQAKIRKTAEKLLLNHLKAMKLKEIAKDIENQRQKSDKKGKNVALESTEVAKNSSEMNAKVTGEYDQETLDAMLAASLAAEEGVSITGNASDYPDGGIVPEEEKEDGDEEEEDEEEEMVLPMMHGKVDPAVLAALPPSMQLDLLVQMRERLMAENRQKYQKVKKAPAKFSELQIQAYLKTVAFRREIDEVQKSAAGKGVGGVQTSRIASEANREFIFSSSFSGDKRKLTSAGVEETAEVERNVNIEHCALEEGHISSDSVNCISSTSQPGSMAGSQVDEPSSCLGDDVETYVDERGRLRVSRVRAMGIRMTRDIQQNLDFLKEIERDKLKEDNSTETEDVLDKIAFAGIENFTVNNHLLKLLDGHDDPINFNGETDRLVQDENSLVVEKRTAMEISFFEDDKGQGGTDDDDLFAQLAAGLSVNMASSMNNLLGKHSDGTSSECSWEEGYVEEKGPSINNDVEDKSRLSLANENISENELDWEDGDINVPDIASLAPTVQNKAISRGSLEEEADIQEAIRRSIEDFTKQKSTTTFNKKESIAIPRDTENHNKVVEVLMSEKDRINLSVRNDLVFSQASFNAVSELEKLDHRGDRKSLEINDPKEKQLASSMELRVKHHEKDIVMHESYNVGILSEGGREYGNVSMETPFGDSVGTNAQKEVHLTVDQRVDALKDDEEGTDFTELASSARDGSHVSSTVAENKTPEVSNVGAHRHDFVAASACYSSEAIGCANSCEEPSAKPVATDVHVEQILVTEKNSIIAGEEIKQTKDHYAGEDNTKAQMMTSEASLDEEMLLLREERENLGDEQRKLERDAESVNSEMFAECQELLQMFGLPYIIAPMEAEAQCAYMEVANLVDGVVTDDSDVFLFGARSVYKNIFDDRKYVETYYMKDIESELGLTREKLIRMALLLGSDYTEGVSGIGIVNAIEVVNAFPEEDGLQNFREWLESPDPTILGTVSWRRGSKASNGEVDSSKHNVEGGFASIETLVEGHNDKKFSDDIQNIRQIFMDKHRNVSKNWHIPSSFPSETVVSAYISPQVDKSTEPFSWGKPDLFILRKLCWEKFGWGNQKADELLVPVLKEYDKHETQLRLEAFYTFNERFAKIRSQRIRKAIKGITGNQSSEVMDDLPQEGSKSRKKRKVCISGPEENKSEKPGIVGSNGNISEKSTPKQSRKRKTGSEALPSEERNSEPPVPKEKWQNTKKGSSGNLRRGRGRGRGTTVGRENKVINRLESTESSSSDGSDYNSEQEDIQAEKTEISSEVRRSRRLRKHVEYAVNGSETGSLSESSDQYGRKCTGAVEQEAGLNGSTSGAAASDISQKDADSLQNNDSFRDYLETGGGFYLEEGDQESKAVELVLCPTRSSNNDGGSNPPEDGLTMDYLKMGGGFCIDEGEPDADPVPSFSGPPAYSSELNGGRPDDPGTTRSPDTPDKEHKYDTSNVGSQQEKADSAGTISTTCLTAMPFLRRKRRKS